MPDTAKDRFSHLIFYVLVILTGYLAFLVVRPFLPSLGWAVVFAIMFHGVHLDLAARLGPGRAALATTLLAAVLIVAPAVMIVSVLAREVPQVIEYVQQVSMTAPERLETIWSALRQRSPVTLPEDPTDMLRQGVQRILTFMAPRAGAVVADVFATVGSLFVMLFSMFFLLRDGQALGRRVRDLIPLPEHESERLLNDTRDLVVASVGAGLLVAVAQGTIGGLTFWALGIRAPVIWGVATGFCSLIPMVGAALVWVPMAAWLLLSGQVVKGLILVAIGAFGISLADNILRPLVLSGRSSASGLIIFLGLLGGVSAFGFIGIVLGPIILVTAGSLVDVFTRREVTIIQPDSPQQGVQGA